MARTLLRVFGWLIVIVLGLLGLALLIATLIYPFEYVRRVIAWGESDVTDYLENFPQRRLEASPETFLFDQASDEERVSELFETILQVDDFEAFLEANDTQAFIIVQGDAILYEKYLNGALRDSMMTSFSVAKSFTTALIGVAVAEGYIGSVNDPITFYLPELVERDPRFGEITIRDLMMMAAGLEYREMRLGLFNGDDPLTTYYPDQRQLALENTRIVDPPGQHFLYNKYHPQLLGLILERATGVSVTEYTQEKLWEPLGMEFSGSWSLDSKASGFEKMEAGLNARAIDFAKFGRLYLKNGNWNGVQVMPAEWVAESTQVDLSRQRDTYYPDEMGQVIFDTLQGYYKYMWYGYARDGGEYDFSAEGDHGQFIYVSPHKNLIIVRNGTEYGSDQSWYDWIGSFYQFASDL
ncbi:MAG TPA: serine hydrolase [Anaerolineae bacterium]|nr:serine hydrolase [Anaerolineae bacterium]